MSDCQRQFVIHNYEPVHDKTNKIACAPSEDPNQPDQSLRFPREESLGPWYFGPGPGNILRGKPQFPVGMQFTAKQIQ